MMAAAGKVGFFKLEMVAVGGHDAVCVRQVQGAVHLGAHIHVVVMPVETLCPELGGQFDRATLHVSHGPGCAPAASGPARFRG